MKTTGKLIFSALIVIFAAGVHSAAAGQGKDLQKTFTWKYNVSKDASISFNNYDCNLTIHTWDKAEAEYHMMIDATARTEEDAATLGKYLDNLTFTNSASSVSFRDNFWKSRNNILGKTTMELENGQKIGLSEFSMKGELWIPSTCRFSLNSKYSQVTMENISGEVQLDLYNDNFFGASLGSKAGIKDKYSTLEFRDVKNIIADIYNSKLSFNNTGDLKIDSKYSKVTAATTGNLEIGSYNDKFDFTKTGDLNLSAKYTDLKSDVSGKVTLDCYEGSVMIKDAKDVQISSKYADFQFGVADNIVISTVYNDKLSCQKLNSLDISESKYCVFRVDELKSSVSDRDGYEDKFTIGKGSQDLKEVSINGKYMGIDLAIPRNLDYRFKAHIQYPKLDIADESTFQSRNKIIDDSHLEYDAVKGKEKEGMTKIEVNGYEVSLKISGF